ncbi:MAG: class I SAM-dependent methyltransferase [Thermoplasmata archaeon]
MPEDEKSFIRKQWDFAADSWADFVGTGKDSGKKVIVPGIISMLPERKGSDETALDVCCGEGFYARLLQERGYKVSGVDISEKMIEIAREKSPGIEYHCSDAAHMPFLDNDSFDMVVCSMGLIDTPDLGGTLKEMHRVMRPEGYLILSIIHPCFDRPRTGAWVKDAEGRKLHFKVDNYMEEGALTINWDMKRLKYPFETMGYHRTLTTYVNTLVKNHLHIDRMLEPCLDDNGIVDEEEFRVPNFLIVRCRKQ